MQWVDPDDDRDQEILAEGLHAFNLVVGPRVGDYVIFADGVIRRLIYDWGDRVQGTDNGSFHLSRSGRINASGRCYVDTPKGNLSPTGDTMPGKVWFFHHDIPGAGRGVDAYADMRVFRSSDNAPTS